jgi:hypothetical protein
MTNTDQIDIQPDAVRFEAALTRLETALATSVQKIANLARRTGFEDGITHASAQFEEVASKSPDLSPILREELEAARAREASLQEAVVAARTALDDAMYDIRSVLGPL